MAVTNDGTNGAPVSELADVGFGMRIAGMEIVKEAADIILIDDDFASIVNALLWGRDVIKNVKEFYRFVSGTRANAPPYASMWF